MLEASALMRFKVSLSAKPTEAASVERESGVGDVWQERERKKRQMAKEDGTHSSHVEEKERHQE